MAARADSAASLATRLPGSHSPVRHLGATCGSVPPGLAAPLHPPPPACMQQTVHACIPWTRAHLRGDCHLSGARLHLRQGLLEAQALPPQPRKGLALLGRLAVGAGQLALQGGGGCRQLSDVLLLVLHSRRRSGRSGRSRGSRGRLHTRRQRCALRTHHGTPCTSCTSRTLQHAQHAAPAAPRPALCCGR